MANFPSTSLQAAEFVGALYGDVLNNATMTQVVNAVNGGASLNAIANAAYNISFANVSTATVGATVATNLGLTGTLATEAADFVAGILTNAPAGEQGQTLLAALNAFANMTSDPTWGAAAATWDAQVANANTYSLNPANTGTASFSLMPTTVAGQTFTLTTGIDTVVVQNTNTIDTVKGVIDQVTGANGTTFTIGDSIQGNGYTVVNLAVESLSTNVHAQLVNMSGVSTVNFQQGQTTTLDANAATWGSVNTITDKGYAATVDITHLNVTNGKGLSLDVSTTGNARAAYIDASKGTVSGLNYYADMANGKGVGSVASFGTSGINASVGKGGYLDLCLSQTAVNNSAAQGAASVGNISIGNVSVNVGASNACANLYIDSDAKAYAHAATAGNITVGNVAFALAENGCAYLDISNYADVASGKGNASAGNITLGNVSVNETGKTGYFSGNAKNDAYAHTGNATDGNLTAGNISLQGAHYAYMELSQYADASNGNAAVGNLTVGNVSLMGATNDYHDLYMYNKAYAYGTKGTAASAGSVSVGTVNMSGSYYAEVGIYNCAYVRDTGTASVGSTTIGNVSMTMKGTHNKDNYLNIDSYATVAGGKGGAATVGSVSLGTVAMAASEGYNYICVVQEAHNDGTKAHNATVGDLSIGNITMTNAPAVTGGHNEIYAYRSADAHYGNAMAGNITVGSISINTAAATLQTNGHNSICVMNEACASHGAATVGSITVGNVSAATGINGYLHLYAYNYADGASSADASGLVSIGNVSVQGGTNAQMYVSAYNYAVCGTAGGIAIGNVSLHETKINGSAELYVYQSGAVAGSVSIGNVAITDHKVGLYVENLAKTGAAGALTIGNITLHGGDFAAYNGILQKASKGNTGAVTVGNVSLSDGKGQTLILAITSEAPLKKAGVVSVGNITLAIANTNAGAAAADKLYVHTTGSIANGGNISVGNVTIGSAGVTTKATGAANMAGHVTLDAGKGNVTVGNITVTGGVTESGGAKAVVDNFATLTTWLSLTNGGGTHTTTIGNVDYSGYAAAATINVSAFAGAASIIGSQGGSTITDNKGTNAIDVSHTTKADTIEFQVTQTAVTDSGGAITATQSAMDSIIGIHSGDTIEYVGAVGMTGAGGVVNGGAMSWATFLTNAEAAIHTSTDAAYTATIGGNTYIAMENASTVGQIVEVVGVHTFTLSGGILSFHS